MRHGRSRRSPLEAAVAAQEPNFPEPGGTPRHPRTAARLARKTGHGGFYPRDAPPDPRLTGRLVAAGYYDEIRAAFHKAKE